MAENMWIDKSCFMNLQTKKFTLVKTKLCISDSDELANRKGLYRTQLKKYI